MRSALFSIVLVALASWLGYHTVLALRDGVAYARGARYKRSARPMMFWFTVVVQIAATLLFVYGLYRELFLRR